ncbi:MAG: ABC transporter permease, partial [Bacillota bacterium]
GFLLMTFLIPVFLFGILGLQTFLMTVGNDDNTKMQIITASEELTGKLEQELSSLEFVKSGHYSFEYKTLDKISFEKHLSKMKNEVLGEKLTGILYLPENAMKDKKIEFYSKSPNNVNMFRKLEEPVNKALVDIYFKDKQFSKEDVSFASKGVDFSGYRVSKDNKIEEEGYGNLVVSFLFTFLLYFSLIITGQLMLRSVVQEKNNRIVEVLLSSVNSRELMTGKIFGSSVTGLVQMAIWLSPLMVLISTSWFMLPAELVLKLSMSQILYFLLNYLVGLITFMGLFASVGAIFDNEQDAQSGMWPIMMLIMIPFFIAISMQNNPGSNLARISSLVPFSSIIVMPARMTLIEVPWWQIMLSLGINLLTMILVFMLAGKIYRVGILMSGKKPKWSEVAKWLKYKY